MKKILERAAIRLAKLTPSDQRRYLRYDCRMKAALTLPTGRILHGWVKDISQGGCLFAAKGARLFFAGSQQAILTVGALTLSCRFVRKARERYFCSFDRDLTETQLRIIAEQPEI